MTGCLLPTSHLRRSDVRWYVCGSCAGACAYRTHAGPRTARSIYIYKSKDFRINLSSTAITGYGPFFCSVTIPLCVRHLRDFLSLIQKRQKMSSECEATAAVNLRKSSFKIRHRVDTQSICLLRCPVSNFPQRPAQMRSHPREWGRAADERLAMIRQYFYINCSTYCRPIELRVTYRYSALTFCSCTSITLTRAL